MNLPGMYVAQPIEKTEFDISQWEECDTECYRNYWLCKFYPPNGPMVEFAMWPGKPLDIAGLRAYIDSRPGLIMFNGLGYDCPMISAALMGYDCATLKNLNDVIIPGGGKQGLPWWQFYRKFDIPEPSWNTIDIMEVAPGVRISLKIYGARMHSDKLQDLPVNPADDLTGMQPIQISTYCGNDLRVTRQLKNTVMDRLRLRHEIGQQYGIEVMSKSDAQIAEAVFKAKLPFKPQKTWLPHGHAFKYKAPDWISFVSPELQDILAMVQRVDYIVRNPDELKVADEDKVYDIDGKEIKSGIQFSDEIRGRDIVIGKSTYRIGIGGLHSKEKKAHFRSVPGKWSITDHDVNSYYPTLMLLMGMYPAGTGPAFLEVFREIYDTRLHAKGMQAQCEAEIDALKKRKVTIHNRHHKTATADTVYIGRGSKWGNPFPITATDDRPTVITKFEQWLKAQPELMAAVKAELVGKDLECFCAPQACHGDVLAAVAAEDRTAALREQAKYWKTISDGLKIVLNGTYGKLGSKYSFLFAPELMIRTTLSGQLALLMLIEMFELNGIRVVSANTDGIVVITPAGLEWLRDSTIDWWHKKTGLETEATEYTAIYNANVNNYIAFKPDGSHKAKGWYGESGVVPKASPSGKSPGMDICNDAVIAFLRDGTSIEQTVMACRDIKRFLVVKNANNPAGGALDERTGLWLGKALRWYYGAGVTTGLRYVANGNLVAGSTGAVPLMDLDGTFPADVDYALYVRESFSMLRDLGVA